MKFKNSSNVYGGPRVSSQVQFSESTSNVRHGDPSSQPLSTGGPLPIAPKPSGTYGRSFVPTEAAESMPTVTTPGTERRVYGFNTNFNDPLSIPVNQQHGPLHSFDMTIDSVDHSYLPEPREGRPHPQQTTHYDFEALESIKHEARDHPPVPQVRTSSLEWSGERSSASLSSSQELLYSSNSRISASAPFYRPSPDSTDWRAPLISSQSIITPPVVPTYNTLNSSLPPESEAPKSASTMEDDEETSKRPPPRRQPPSVKREYTWGQSRVNLDQEEDIVEDEASFDVSVDDAKMADFTDDEDRLGDGLDIHHLSENDLGVGVALQARQEIHGLALRSITSYIDRPDMLATYVPSPQASPLQDAMVARIFCHFINVTGPTMSMFERHPANPSLIFQGRPVLKSQQHIWTCEYLYAVF